MFKLSMSSEIADDSIRADYLRNNEAYITNSLRRLADIPDLVGSGSVELYAKHRDAFKKCGDKIKTWIAVNADWRSRCEKYGAGEQIVGRWRGPSSFDIEEEGVDMVFNNPAVAVELGLLEVLKVHVEEFGTDISSQEWTGLLTNYPGDNYGLSLMHLALVTDDQDLLEYVLDAPTFNFSIEIGRFEWFYDVLKPGAISLESVEKLFAHEDVRVNFQWEFCTHETPLRAILEMLRMHENHVFVMARDNADRHAEVCERALDILRIMLRCGADPQYDISRSPEHVEDHETPIGLARKILSEKVLKPVEERDGWNIKYLSEYIDLVEKEGKNPCKKRRIS